MNEVRMFCIDEEKMFSKDVKCVVPPKDGNFTVGVVYHLVYNRMNDIVWYTCLDNDNVRVCFHERGWNKYFKEI